MWICNHGLNRHLCISLACLPFKFKVQGEVNRREGVAHDDRGKLCYIYIYIARTLLRFLILLEYRV